MKESIEDIEIIERYLILLLGALFTAIPDNSYALYGSVKAMGSRPRSENPA